MNCWKSTLCRLAGNMFHIAVMGSLLKWIVYGGLAGLLSGSASALFLTGLDLATESRINHPWLLYLLPFGGAFMSYLYLRIGQNSSKGNNLLLENVHGALEPIPLRMAPLVLAGTLLTHLFGGSAGREGTAVQMGGSLSAWIGKIGKTGRYDHKQLVMRGISSGFGSVFGTPLAGTIFGLEVAAIGLVSYEAILPCFIASLRATRSRQHGGFIIFITIWEPCRTWLNRRFLRRGEHAARLLRDGHRAVRLRGHRVHVRCVCRQLLVFRSYGHLYIAANRHIEI